MLRFDNVVSADAERDKRTLAGLGIEPTALEIVLPTYLARFRERGRVHAGARLLRASACRSACTVVTSGLIRAFMPHVRISHRDGSAGQPGNDEQPSPERPERDEADDADDDPPPGEGHEAVAAHEAHERPHDDQRRDERDARSRSR